MFLFQNNCGLEFPNVIFKKNKFVSNFYCNITKATSLNRTITFIQKSGYKYPDRFRSVSKTWCQTNQNLN